MGLTEIRRLKQLEEENSKLKRLDADLSLDKAILQDVLGKKFEAYPVKSAGRARACGIRDFAATSVRYAALQSNGDAL